MTQVQENKIKEFRSQGMGYRAIATTVGLSRDIVRNYCKGHNMAGYAPAMKKNIRLMMAEGTACNNCGSSLTRPATGRPKRFCCEKCRRIWWKSHPEAVKHSKESSYELICARCGRTFISYGNKARKYCSHDCYIKYRFWEGEDGICKS